MPINTLICTLGTSLIGNLKRPKQESETNPTYDNARQAFRNQNWQQLAFHLSSLAPSDRFCGAEINSVASLDAKLEIEKYRLHLLHSDTEDGRNIAELLRMYFERTGWEEVIAHSIDGLKDDDPDIFRTHGLRNLVRTISKLVRESGGVPDQGAPPVCAINSTGGYKAQIAIGVLMGQSLGIPVYYKHEFFDRIIEFPPMPVSLDYPLWQKASGMFMALDGESLSEWSLIQHGWNDQDHRDDHVGWNERFWDERFEPLIERISEDGKEFVALSPAGQIFHETFRNRFDQRRKRGGLSLPPKAQDKEEPKLTEHDYKQARNPITRFMQKVTNEVPYVRRCSDRYWNPDLPAATMFRQSSHGIEGVYSNGSWTFKFYVQTTAEDDTSYDDIVADLNAWLAESGAG